MTRSANERPPSHLSQLLWSGPMFTRMLRQVQEISEHSSQLKTTRNGWQGTLAMYVVQPSKPSLQRRFRIKNNGTDQTNRTTELMKGFVRLPLSDLLNKTVRVLPRSMAYLFANPHSSPPLPLSARTEYDPATQLSTQLLNTMVILQRLGDELRSVTNQKHFLSWYDETKRSKQTTSFLNVLPEDMQTS